jgi:hypothetical protein
MLSRRTNGRSQPKTFGESVREHFRFERPDTFLIRWGDHLGFGTKVIVSVLALGIYVLLAVFLASLTGPALVVVPVLWFAWQRGGSASPAEVRWFLTFMAVGAYFLLVKVAFSSILFITTLAAVLVIWVPAVVEVRRGGGGLGGALSVRGAFREDQSLSGRERRRKTRRAIVTAVLLLGIVILTPEGMAREVDFATSVLAPGSAIGSAVGTFAHENLCAAAAGDLDSDQQEFYANYASCRQAGCAVIPGVAGTGTVCSKGPLASGQAAIAITQAYDPCKAPPVASLTLLSNLAKCATQWATVTVLNEKPAPNGAILPATPSGSAACRGCAPGSVFVPATFLDPCASGACNKAPATGGSVRVTNTLVAGNTPAGAAVKVISRATSLVIVKGSIVVTSLNIGEQLVDGTTLNFQFRADPTPSSLTVKVRDSCGGITILPALIASNGDATAAYRVTPCRGAIAITTSATRQGASYDDVETTANLPETIPSLSVQFTDADAGHAGAPLGAGAPHFRAGDNVTAMVTVTTPDGNADDHVSSVGLSQSGGCPLATCTASTKDGVATFVTPGIDAGDYIMHWTVQTSHTHAVSASLTTEFFVDVPATIQLSNVRVTQDGQDGSVTVQGDIGCSYPTIARVGINWALPAKPINTVPYAAYTEKCPSDGSGHFVETHAYDAPGTYDIGVQYQMLGTDAYHAPVTPMDWVKDSAGNPYFALPVAISTSANEPPAGSASNPNYEGDAGTAGSGQTTSGTTANDPGTSNACDPCSDPTGGAATPPGSQTGNSSLGSTVGSGLKNAAYGTSAALGGFWNKATSGVWLVLLIMLAIVAALVAMFFVARQRGWLERFDIYPKENLGQGFSLPHIFRRHKDDAPPPAQVNLAIDPPFAPTDDVIEPPVDDDLEGSFPRGRR